MTNAPKREHSELQRRITAVGRQWRTRAVGAGLLHVLAIALGGSLVLLLFESLLSLPAAARLVMMLALLVWVVHSLTARVIRPLARRIDPVAIAARIEKGHPELGESLESATELWEKRGTGKHGYSTDLIDGLIVQTVMEVSGLDLGAAERPVAIRRAGFRLLAALAACAVGLPLMGARLAPAFDRLRDPLATEAVPGIAMTVEPGDVTVVAGDDLTVRAKLFVAPGADESAPTLTVGRAGEPPTTTVMEEFSRLPAAAGGVEATTAVYVAAIPEIRVPLTYSVELESGPRGSYDVRVIDPPFVTGLDLELDFPSYSGLLPRASEDNGGDVTALPGTAVRVTLSASKPLESARLERESGTDVEMERLGADTFRGRFIVTGDDAYAVHLIDTDGLVNATPPTYSISAIRDERPLVRIVEPGEDLDVPRDMALPLVISGIDDYGVTRIDLRYALEGSAAEVVSTLGSYGSRGEREVVVETVWDLSETGLLPGATLVYFAEVFDSDAVGGPKSSRSESYLLRFPSMAELYQDVVEEQDEILDDLDELMDEQEEVREEFDELAEDVRSDPELDWQDEERVEQALERQEQLADEVSNMAERMADLGDQMSESDRVTLETLEKVDQIRDLLDEVATDEMRELLEQIREAMREISPEQMSSAMEQMSFTQDDYLRRLEQTLNMLKRAKAEQTLADVANRADDLAQREEQAANESAQSPDAERSAELSAEQRDMAAELEQLKRDLEQAISEMGEVDPEAAAEMQQALDQLEQADTAQKMEQAAQMLAELKPQEASAQCESASNDLKSLFTRLSQCQGSMACSIQQRDREATLRAIDELLGISSEQESILDVVSERPRLPRIELVELVARQTDLAEALGHVGERMFRVSNDSFQIDAATYRRLALIRLTMLQAAGRLADGGGRAAERSVLDALESVNATIVEFLTSNQSSSSSGGSGALQQLMQQLQQMAEQQAQLNQMTESLQRQMGEQGDMSHDEQLARMRAEQERLMEQARRLAEEFGDRSEVLGRLDDTVEEMEGTLAEMEEHGASQEAVDRQKRILSRLLDAQRSLRRRDYTRERRSSVGDNYRRVSPDALADEITQARRELREDLLRAMQREYPSEYRELIRAYFESLARDVAGEGETGADNGAEGGRAEGGGE